MKKTKLFIAALAAIFFFAQSEQAIAQLQAPAPSPAASVSQVVGFTKISIDYSSPAVKGRKVFGELEKYGTPWRAGANAQTIIEFSTSVNIGGTNLRPGKYSIFVTPNESGDWVFHFNSKGNSVFAYMKDGKIDMEALGKDLAVSVNAAPEKLDKTKERLQYYISAEDNKVAKVSLAWENVKVSFMVDTQVDQKMDAFKAAF